MYLEAFSIASFTVLVVFCLSFIKISATFSDDLKDWVYTEVEKLYQCNWFNKTNLEKELDLFFKGDNQSSFHVWQWINAAQLLKQ